MEWKKYVQELIDEINKQPGTAIVGVSGCYYKSTYRECEEKNLLRVYVNGGDAFQIPLKSKIFKFANKYLKEPYLDKDTIERIEEIKKIIRDNPFKFKEKNFTLLKEYLGYMQKATNVKYKSSMGKNGSSKERKYQVLLYKQLIEEPREDMSFFDLEFQTIVEMNYGVEYVKEWMGQGKDIRELHSGKPDYIAFNKEGFVIVELKTNNAACDGNAGLNEHNNDFDNILLKNKENHIFVTELLRRLQIMYDFDLISSNWKTTAKNILEMKKDEIKLCVKYMFITNPDFTREMCEKKIKDYGFTDDECIIVES